MNTWIAVLSLLAVASARPQFGGKPQYTSNAAPIPIVRQSNDLSPDGTAYQFSFETGNGIRAEETGRLENVGNPEREGVAVQGSSSYTGDDGVVYTITYVADADGYRPVGAHLPTPPPIPEAILRALEFNAANPDPSEGRPGGAGAFRPAPQPFGGNRRPAFGRK